MHGALEGASPARGFRRRARCPGWRPCCDPGGVQGAGGTWRRVLSQAPCFRWPLGRRPPYVTWVPAFWVLGRRPGSFSEDPGTPGEGAGTWASRAPASEPGEMVRERGSHCGILVRERRPWPHAHRLIVRFLFSGRKRQSFRIPHGETLKPSPGVPESRPQLLNTTALRI